MASYSIRFRESAALELRESPFPFRRQLNQQVHALRDNPRPDHAEPLEGSSYRLTISGWSIAYEVDDDACSVIISAIFR